MTASRETKGGRNRTLGADAVKVNVSLPKEVYDALTAAAADDFDAIGTTARRLIVAGLRERGNLQ